MPKSSRQINSDVMGLLVTPQNTEPSPTAAHIDGDKPIIEPNTEPNEAPIKNDGTISPPL